MDKQTQYKEFQTRMARIADVNSSIAILNWDKEVNLPPKGARFRTQQLATLEGIVHEMIIDKDFGRLLERLDNGNSLNTKDKRNVSLALKDYQKINKLSKEFVMRRSRAISETYHAWIEARKANDFNMFKTPLKKLVEIKREEAQTLGYKDHPYDILMDEFEPGASTAALTELFAYVRQQLVDFVRKIRKQPQVNDSFLRKFYDKDKQWQLGIDLLKNMGYDLQAGRQDLSPHPFTTQFSPEDVRVTTRIDEYDFANMLWSCIHEGGHALYEQGLPTNQYGMPLGTHISLGIHESQSRLYENNVGRSYNYWKAHYPRLQAIFPDNLRDVSLMDFYKAINKVSPSLIRTESDELHYHFHILIRFEIEKGLIEGSLEVDNLDKVWMDKYREYLDLDVPDAANGILQDIHWSHGSFGYFPTYSMGSFYAAQFYDQASKDIPNFEGLIASGNNQPLLDWLRTNIHQHGRFFTAEELCKRVTGEKLNFKYFMDYAKKKYEGIYF